MIFVLPVLNKKLDVNYNFFKNDLLTRTTVTFFFYK